jgi:anti-sigma regulatory factor (Ser/Thr protein kinase)
MPNVYRLTRVAHLDSLCDFRDFLKANCAGSPGVTKKALYDLQLAVDEACANIILHMAMKIWSLARSFWTWR